MDLKEIRELVKLLDKSSLSELEFENDDYSIRLAKNSAPQITTQAAVAPTPIIQASPNTVAAPENLPESTTEEAHNYSEIKSPMVGTFYAASSPDAEPFVKVGDHISEGDTLCIIEAMKLMNELKSEQSGKVVKVLVQNAEAVEYNQVLFHVE